MKSAYADLLSNCHHKIQTIKTEMHISNACVGLSISLNFDQASNFCNGLKVAKVRHTSISTVIQTQWKQHFFLNGTQN